MSKRVNIPEFKALLKDYGYPVSTVTRKIAKEISEWYDVCIPSTLYDNKVSRGVFKLVGATESNIDYLFEEEVKKPVKQKPVTKAVTEAVEVVEEELSTKINEIAFTFKKGHFIPEKDPFYVKWSALHKDLKQIMNSNQFFPAYITGLSGNGKTFTVEQLGAELKREVIIVNFTEETSEDDLIGSWRLINGDTVWEDGPVVVALKRGAVLVLDEIDLGGARVMTLQSILSGKGVYIKKINKFVKPEEGFTVIATGNTKGKGDDGHGMMFTNLLSEPMLDRFAVTFEQDYPSVANEVKILKRAYEVITGKDTDKEDEQFFDGLAKTGKLIRDDYYEGGIDSILSTRRLVDIVRTYIVFNKDRVKAFELCTNRFDGETYEAMRDLYKAVDSGAHETEQQSEDLKEHESSEVPF